MNNLPGRDDLPPGTSLRDIDPDPRPWIDDEDGVMIRCCQCGRCWNDPKMSPDGVCPWCFRDMNKR